MHVRVQPWAVRSQRLIHHQLTELDRIIRQTSWLWSALVAVRQAAVPDAYVAAGAVRDTVWDHLCGEASAGPFGDVDVVYFSCTDQPPAEAHRERLVELVPQLPWEVTNQATVHEWHAAAEGLEVAPHKDVSEALRTWPETATATAVRLGDGRALEVLAPFGLDDLFGLTARYNPALVDVATFRARVRTKRWQERWPHLRVVT